MPPEEVAPEARVSGTMPGGHAPDEDELEGDDVDGAEAVPPVVSVPVPVPRGIVAPLGSLALEPELVEPEVLPVPMDPDAPDDVSLPVDPMLPDDPVLLLPCEPLELALPADPAPVPACATASHGAA